MASSGLTRLRNSAEIADAMDRSRRAVGRHIVVYVAPRLDGVSGMAVIASRKVGNAVQRNRAKRVIRAAFATLSVAEGYSIVVVARGSASRASMAEVASELSSLMVQCQVVSCQIVA